MKADIEKNVLEERALITRTKRKISQLQLTKSENAEEVRALARELDVRQLPLFANTENAAKARGEAIKAILQLAELIARQPNESDVSAHWKVATANLDALEDALQK